MAIEVGLVELGSVTKWLSGGTPNRAVDHYWNGDIPWISASTLKESEVSNSDQCVTKEAVALGSKMAPVNSTLLLVRGSALHNEIRAGLVVRPVCFNQDVKALIPILSVYPKFLTYSILGRQAQLLEMVSSAGNTAGVLDTKLLQAFKIWLPDVDEQRTIATVLSDVDSLIAGLERLIAKKRDIQKAAMQQLLTGQTRLPGFSGVWAPVQLGDLLVRLSNGAVYRPGSQNDVPITRIETIANGTVDYARVGFAAWDEGLAQYALMPDDILFSHINSVDHIGKVAIVPKDEQPLYHGMNLLLMRAAPNCNSQFLFFWLRSEDTRRHMRVLAKQAVSQASINTSELRVVRLAMPPRDEQDEIANVLSDIDADLSAIESRLAKTRAVKQGMMQELLTGRTRLV